MESYLDAGYNEFLSREPMISQQQQDPLMTDQLNSEISGSKVQGGVMSSPNGKSQYDLDSGTFRVNNGIQNLVELGVLTDGSIGLLIQDKDGNVLLKVSEGEFYLQSPLKTSRLDLIADKYTIRNEFGDLKVLIGKDEGGF